MKYYYENFVENLLISNVDGSITLNYFFWWYFRYCYLLLKFNCNQSYQSISNKITYREEKKNPLEV